MKIFYSALTENFWMHVTEIVNQFVKAGHEVHVAGFRPTRPKNMHPSVKFNNVTLRNRAWRGYCDSWFWKCFLKWGKKRLFSRSKSSFSEFCVEEIIKSNAFDLVYERNCFLNPAVHLAKKQAIPSILEFNGFWPLEAEWKKHTKEEVIRFKQQEVNAANQATRVICVGEGAREGYASFGVKKEKISVIPNGANPDLFYPMDKILCRKRLGFKSKDVLIGFSGSLQIFYELDTLIRAIPFISNEIPDIRLVIVGRDCLPPYGLGKRALQSLAKELGVLDRIDFHSIVPYEEVSYYLNSFDLCLLPLLEKGEWRAALSPLKLREYFACGRPVVGSNVAGESQIIHKIHGGVLYMPGDPKDLAEKVCTLLVDQAKLRQMSENARHFILSQGTWRHVSELIISVIDEIVEVPTDTVSAREVANSQLL